MNELILILSGLLVMIGLLLFQIALKYRTWITTLTIALVLSISVSGALAIYDKIGYPKEIHLFQEKWMMHHFVPSDENQTFFIMIQEGRNKPRLVAYKISNRENYNKQKEGLKQAMKAGKEGQPFLGEFANDTEEFRFHKFNLAEVYKK
jgi:hypothetical protein